MEFVGYLAAAAMLVTAFAARRRTKPTDWVLAVPFVGSFRPGANRRLAIAGLLGAFATLAALAGVRAVTNGARTGRIGYEVISTRPSFDAHKQLKVGDLVVEVNGKPVNKRLPLRDLVNERGDAPLPIAVRRERELLQLELKPYPDPGNGRLRLGFTYAFAPEVAPAGLMSIASAALFEPVRALFEEPYQFARWAFFDHPYTFPLGGEFKTGLTTTESLHEGFRLGVLLWLMLLGVEIERAISRSGLFKSTESK